MDDDEFSGAIAKALGVCRAAAELKLPIEAALDRLGDALLGPDATPQQRADTENLITILFAVGDVAAIGAKLPPAAPDLAALPCPLPANLRSA